MWAALFGPKKPENEHNIQVKFAPGWTCGFIEPRSMQMPPKWMSDTEDWESVNSLAWQGIIRTIEQALHSQQTETFKRRIRWRGCLAACSIIGLILGFMLGFLLSFLGCSDGNPGMCATGLTFAAIFVLSLIGMFVGFFTMMAILPAYARNVLNQLEPELLKLQAQNPNMRIDLMNVNLQGAAQFDIRIKLKSRSECELEQSTAERRAAELPPSPKKVSESGLIAPLPEHLPSYWTNQDLKEHFRQRCDVSAESRELFQVLLDNTFRTRSTRDRQGKMPRRLRLMKCHRVEDSSMWSSYLLRLARLRAKWSRCTSISEHYTAGQDSPDAQAGDVCTHQPLGGFVHRLDATLNEFYLMHGTSPDGALGITDSGFRLDLTGSHAGTMFGNGAYFAECSSKADEYSSAGEGIYEGVYAMLLCRVCCGQMLRMLRPDPALVQQAIATEQASAVLGDREASVGTYREFVVFDSSQVYPEYVILYEREF